MANSYGPNSNVIPDAAGNASIDSYRDLQLTNEYAGRAIYRGFEPKGGNLVYLTMLPGIRFPAAVPLRDSINILRMRVDEASGKLRELQDHNYLQLLNAGEINGSPYFVHRFRDGTTLKNTLVTGGRLGFESAISMLVEIASALDNVHTKNIFHGALCTDTIFLDRNGAVFISDLGTEYALQPLLIASAEPSFSELRYFAPERLRGASLNRKTDLYSLAIIAFEALTAHSPFTSSATQQLKNEILSGHYERVANFVSNISPAVDEVFARALAPQLSLRFDSAREFVCALASALRIEPLTLSFGKKADKAPKKDAGDQPSSSNGSILFGDAAGTVSATQPAQKQSERIRRSLFNERAEQSAKINYKPEKARLHGLVIGSVTALIVAVALVLASKNAGSASASTSNTILAAIPYRSAQDESIEIPAMEPAPAGISANELSDRQLIGLVWQNSAPAASLIDALREAQRRHLSDLVNAAIAPLRNGDPLVRTAAVQIVGTLGDKRMVPFLLETLTDPVPEVRGASAHALGVLGNSKTLPFLVARYNTETGAELRQEIKSAIDKISGYAVSDAELAAITH